MTLDIGSVASESVRQQPADLVAVRTACLQPLPGHQLDNVSAMREPGDRRSVEVMVKNDRLYKDTGGWGFDRFSGNGKTAVLSSKDRARCFACHGTQKERDSVFSSIRP